MPTKSFSGVTVTYTVRNVTINQDASVTSYPATDAHLAELLLGLQNAANWTCDFEVNAGNRRTAPSITRVRGLGWPVVDGHPGHVEGSGWKYNIERGTGSVDRLVLSNWRADVVAPGTAEAGGSTITHVQVAITVDARALKNTH